MKYYPIGPVVICGEDKDCNIVNLNQKDGSNTINVGKDISLFIIAEEYGNGCSMSPGYASVISNEDGGAFRYEPGKKIESYDPICVIYCNSINRQVIGYEPGIRYGYDLEFAIIKYEIVLNGNDNSDEDDNNNNEEGGRKRKNKSKRTAILQRTVIREILVKNYDFSSLPEEIEKYRGAMYAAYARSCCSDKKKIHFNNISPS